MLIFFFLMFIGILVFIELMIYSKHGFKNMDVDVHFSQNIANFGDTIEVVEIAKNNKRLPLPFLILKFETPAAIKFNDLTNIVFTDNYYREDMLTMHAFSKHTRKIKVTCTKRGYYTFTRVTCSSADLLLFMHLTMDYNANSSILILPEIISTDELNTLMSVTLSEITSRRTLLTDPFCFSGIREYQPWDPMKSINWSATARVGDLMVNQTTSTSDRRINVFLNLETYNVKKSTSLLEKSISLAYSYMIALSNEGVTISFYSNGRDVITDTPIVSKASSGVFSIQERGIELARIDLTKEVKPFINLMNDYIAHNNSNDLNVIISANYDAPFREKLSDIISQGKSVFWIMPCYSGDPFSKKMIPDSLIAPHFLKLEVPGRD